MRSDVGVLLLSCSIVLVINDITLNLWENLPEVTT